MRIVLCCHENTEGLSVTFDAPFRYVRDGPAQKEVAATQFAGFIVTFNNVMDYDKEGF